MKCWCGWLKHLVWACVEDGEWTCCGWRSKEKGKICGHGPTTWRSVWNSVEKRCALWNWLRKDVLCRTGWT